MEIIIFLVVFIFLFLLIINYLRKLQLDAIHFNFLTLIDEIGGTVLRKGFLSRPVYHGSFKGIEVTINFSSERSQKKRRQYLNISLAKSSKHNITISPRTWIEGQQGGSSESFERLEINGDITYLIKKPRKTEYLKKDRKKEFADCITSLAPFNYVYLGTSGILFERECENLATCTKHPKLKKDIEMLFRLTNTIR